MKSAYVCPRLWDEMTAKKVYNAKGPASDKFLAQDKKIKKFNEQM